MLEAAAARPARRPQAPPVDRRVLDADGPEARIDALTKLKKLFDSGVLTDRQFADERERLLGG
jgi:Short C-terminal domain